MVFSKGEIRLFGTGSTQQEWSNAETTNELVQVYFHRFMKKKTTAAAHNAQIKEARTTAPAMDIPELVLFLESLKQLIAAAGS